jgi:hypothetical protein
MTQEKREALLRIIADPASIPEEISEAKLQLNEASLRTQSEEDKILVRFLDGALDREERMTLPEPTQTLLFALTGWMLAADCDKIDDNIALLIDLYSRTKRERIKQSCIEAIQEWDKLARLYRHKPQSEAALRRSTRFLDLL